MNFDSSSWIDRLHDDEALTDNLDDDQAHRLLGWGEKELAACASDADAERVLAAMRELNRRVGDGGEPEPLLAALEGATMDAPTIDDREVTDRPAIAEEREVSAGEMTARAAAPGQPSEPPEKSPAADAPPSSTENNQRPSSTS